MRSWQVGWTDHPADPHRIVPMPGAEAMLALTRSLAEPA